MTYIVMPIKNEAFNLNQALDNLINLPITKVIAVINGCIDNTEEVILDHPLYKENKIIIIKFIEALGIDVPRAVGAAYAYLKTNCQAVVFVDGDMTGNISRNLQHLIEAVTTNKVDMALTNCYPYINNREPLVKTILNFREKLISTLGLLSQLGVSLPSHGPHGLSRRSLEIIPWEYIAIPPLSLAYGAQHKLNIKVVTSIPHQELLSAPRKLNHSIKVAETIIGDCIEAINYIKYSKRDRTYNSLEYLGYHPERRFDLLQEYIASLT